MDVLPLSLDIYSFMPFQNRKTIFNGASIGTQMMEFYKTLNERYFTYPYLLNYTIFNIIKAIMC